MTFVLITKQEFESCIEYIVRNNLMLEEWSIIEEDSEDNDRKLPCHEFVYKIDIRNTNSFFKIYSTVNKTTEKSRNIGKDRIRVVLYENKEIKPYCKKIKWINRTIGKTNWRARLKKAIDEAIRTYPRCRHCGDRFYIIDGKWECKNCHVKMEIKDCSNCTEFLLPTGTQLKWERGLIYLKCTKCNARGNINRSEFHIQELPKGYFNTAYIKGVRTR